ncbi:hypothetical protein [Nocardia sp. AG03]|uniref:hypothetical protein n=1 Tax=Nocardia sp. AG03 TaxID=3025312 RepID=UPI0024181CF9|nr:hypothetical protein [Nocardia sp. AG03]
MTNIGGERTDGLGGVERQLAVFDVVQVNRQTFGENAFHRPSLLRIGRTRVMWAIDVRR